MSINDILEKYGMNRRELAERLKIEYRTVQKWALPEDVKDHRKCPDYMLRLIVAILENNIEIKDV